jgi:arginine/serine-rich splicing factor 1/9
VTGLPKSCSWQDLKDFMRKAGDVVFADVDHHGEGVVEFSNREDMERAVEKLDDEKFENSYGSSYIRVKFANKRGGNSRDRSRDRRDSRRSPSRSRSRSRDRKARDYESDDEDRYRKHDKDDVDDEPKGKSDRDADDDNNNDERAPIDD